MRSIHLSKVEVTYLSNSRFLPEDLAQVVDNAEAVNDGARSLRLEQDVAERFRDEFTARLAKTGFGKNYEPTREGKLLEELIDRFATKR